MLDWLFVPQCAACRTPADPLCEGCLASLDPLDAACVRCGEPEPAGATCRRCAAHPPPLDRITSPWRYGGALAVAIKRLKFAGETHVARAVAPLWADLVAAAAAPDALVVPVPLHWRRRQHRGYDHALLLARHACRTAGLPAPCCALRRTRGAPPQSKLSAAARAANLVGAFAVRDPRIAGRAVVLVDDVVTTGATLAAAARALLDGGAARVVGVCLARATSAP